MCGVEILCTHMNVRAPIVLTRCEIELLLISMSPPAFEWVILSVAVAYGGPIIWGIVCSRFRTRIGLFLLILPFLLLAVYAGLGNLWALPFYLMAYGPYLALGYIVGLWLKQRKRSSRDKSSAPKV